MSWLLLAALAGAQDTIAEVEPTEPVALPGPDLCPIWNSADGAEHLCARAGRAITFATWGSHRLIATGYPDLEVDARGGTVGQTNSFDHRFRVGAGFGVQTVRFSTEWDLLQGQVAGDLWNLGSLDTRARDRRTALTREGQTPRRASVSAVIPDRNGGRVPNAIVEVGLMPSTWWGLGLLANTGGRETQFGRVDRGDRMLRARGTFAPWRKDSVRMPLFFTVGFDTVIEDDTARWNEGQRAFHAIASVIYRGAGKSLGFFYTYRNQTEPGESPRPTSAHVMDLYGSIDLDLAGWSLNLATEDVLIVGSTERALSYVSPSSTRILTGAAVAHATLKDPSEAVRVHLRGGWTSATGDPDSGVLQDFTLDSNYNVGLVLFDELGGALESGTYALLEDPTLTGGPPPGADGLVTEGSVRRAAWIWPSLEVHATTWLDVRAGYLAAWSTGPIAQPFYTARAGGTPTNHLDRATEGRFIGHEIQWGIGLGRGDFTKDWRFRPKLWVEGGVGLPSEDLGGGVMNLVRGTVQVDW